MTQVVMLILFYFLIAWKEPFPPIPSYGIELSFGLEETGQGEIAPGTPEPQEETEETEEVAEEQPEEVIEEIPTEAVEESEVEEVPVSETPSPDVVEEKKEVTPPPVKETKPEQEVKEEVLPPPNTTTESETVSPSQGTTTEPGDEGKKEGVVDDRALYGSQGGGENGASLQMAGWTWDSPPNPNDQSDETGKIVYEITIDDEGYIITIVLKSSTVSPEIQRLYRESVGKLTFSKNSEYKPAPTSSGTITFLIQTK